MSGVAGRHAVVDLLHHGYGPRYTSCKFAHFLCWRDTPLRTSSYVDNYCGSLIECNCSAMLPRTFMRLTCNRSFWVHAGFLLNADFWGALGWAVDPCVCLFGWLDFCWATVILRFCIDSTMRLNVRTATAQIIVITCSLFRYCYPQHHTASMVNKEKLRSWRRTAARKG